MAESIPDTGQAALLSQWLQVPAEWLRFGGLATGGGKEGQAPVDKTLGAMLAAMSREDLKLVEALHALEADERRLVREMVQLFFRTQERALQEAASA